MMSAVFSDVCLRYAAAKKRNILTAGIRLPNGKGQKINILTTVPDYGMTLYANWRPEL